MKSFFSALFLAVLLSTSGLLFGTQAFAQELPRIPESILGNLEGYSTSYISGGPYGGSILVIGGVRNGTEYQSKALLYDPDNRELITPDEGTLQLGTRRAYHTATPLADGRILLFGGESAQGSYVSLAELFDPVTFSFSPVSLSGAALPNAKRKNHAATFFYSLGSSKQYVLITGGCVNSCTTDSETLRDSIVFDVDNAAFMAGPLMNNARQKHTATYLPTAASLGAVMQMGGNRTDAEYFDIETFAQAAGSGRFVQNETVRQIIAENQFLLKIAPLPGQTPPLESNEVLGSIPAAISSLLSGEATQAQETPPEDTDALRQQLADLHRLQQSINSLRVPGSAPHIIASDARGRVAVSGAGHEETPQATTVSQEAAMETNVAKALIESQQERVASLLRGGALGTTWTGSGTIINSIPTEATYAADFALFLTSLEEKNAAFLSSLTDFARDSDNDGIGDKAELVLGLHPFAQDSNGDGVSDSDAFLGVPVGNDTVVWAASPRVHAACGEGVLWGRTKPTTEVGLFLQGEGAQRTQVARTVADSRGFFMARLPKDMDTSVRLVWRISTSTGFVYSDVRQLTLSSCETDSIVMIDRISVHEGRRQVEGRAKAGALVLLNLQDTLLATMANDKGQFVMQLPLSLSAGRVDIRTWQVHEGQVSALQSYVFDIPLGSQLVPQDGSGVRASAHDESNAFFWWVYTIGLLLGITTLCGLAFYVWRMYPASVIRVKDRTK